MCGTYCDWSKCPKSKDCKRFMIVNKEIDSYINYKAICPDSPKKPYEYWIEMDKEVVVKEKTEKDVVNNDSKEL